MRRRGESMGMQKQDRLELVDRWTWDTAVTQTRHTIYQTEILIIANK